MIYMMDNRDEWKDCDSADFGNITQEQVANYRNNQSVDIALNKDNEA